MIDLSHLNLNTIALAHKEGIHEWVKERFDIIKECLDYISTKSTFQKVQLNKNLQSIKHLRKKKIDKIIDHLEVIYRDSNLCIDCNHIMYEIDKLSIEKTLQGDLKILERLVTDIYPTFKKYQKKTKKEIKYEPKFHSVIYLLNFVFDYEKFKKYSNGWNAYSLASELDVKTCPYCNRLYTSTVLKKSKTASKRLIRNEFDHFRIQSLHPYLALSFYNLIPSCKSCNSSLKGETDMSKDKYVHPYLGGFNKALLFRTGVKLKDFLNDKSVKFDISFEEDKTNMIYSKARNNADLFEIETIYNEHKDLARDMFKRSVQESKSHLKGIVKLEGESGARLYSDKYEFYRVYTSTFYLNKDHYKRPFSKFQFDIADEVGLIKIIDDLFEH